MSLRIRRGTNAQRAGITFDLGEIAYTTDTKKLYIGDGTTVGGKHVLATSAGNGFTFNENTQQIEFSLDNLDLENLNLSTTGVPEGTRLYFTTERAQDAVAAALVAGNPFNVGVTFTYDNANNRITAVSTGGGSGLTTVSSDTNPSLGGNLSLNGFNISGSGTISATSLSSTTLTVTNLGGNLNGGAYNITNIGNIGATTITATNLGGNLAAGSYNITGVGNLGATTLTATNLGGSLNAASYNITGISNLSTTNLTATNLVGNLNIGTNSITGTGFISADTITATNLGSNMNVNAYNLNNIGNIDAETVTGSKVITTEITPDIDASVIINGRSENPLVIKGIVTSVDPNGINLEIRAAGGTILNPTSIFPGSTVASIKTFGYYDAVYKQALQLTTLWSPDANLQRVYPKSALYFSIGNNTDDQELKASLDGNGTFKSNIIQLTSYPSTSYPAGGNNIALTSVQTIGTSGQFQCANTSAIATLVVGGTVTISGTNTGTGSISGYTNPTTYYIIATNGTTTFTLSTTTNGSGVVTTAGTLAGLTYSVLLPEAGMMIFDNTTNKFMGYNGTNWVAFTGP